MTVSGIVITFGTDEESSRMSQEALARETAIELGHSEENKLPAVIDATDARESRRLYSWIEQLSGVEKVDVVFVSMDPELEEATGGAHAG